MTRGMIGLESVDTNMTERLVRASHRVVGFDPPLLDLTTTTESPSWAQPTLHSPWATPTTSRCSSEPFGARVDEDTRKCIDHIAFRNRMNR